MPARFVATRSGPFFLSRTQLLSFARAASHIFVQMSRHSQLVPARKFVWHHDCTQQLLRSRWFRNVCVGSTTSSDSHRSPRHDWDHVAGDFVSCLPRAWLSCLEPRRLGECPTAGRESAPIRAVLVLVTVSGAGEHCRVSVHRFLGSRGMNVEHVGVSLLHSSRSTILPLRLPFLPFFLWPFSNATAPLWSLPTLSGFLTLYKRTIQFSDLQNC
jgi:hypothetical protein